MKVFVDPDWRKVVGTSDHAFIESTIDDFRDRAKSDPEALFEQASSLSVGPLVTHEQRAFRANDPQFSSLLERFVEIN